MKRDMFLRILLGRIFAIFVVSACLLCPYSVWAQNNKAAQAVGFEVQRAKLEREINEVLAKTKTLEQEQKNLERQIKALEKEKKKLEVIGEGRKLLGIIDPRKVRDVTLSLIGIPLGLFLESLLYSLPFCIVLLFLWLLYFKKEFFKKWMVPVLILFVVLFLLSILPVFAAENPKKPTTLEEKLQKDLQTAYDICTEEPVDKAIRFLKNRPSKTLEIPDEIWSEIKMPPRLSFLKPFKVVSVDTSEYHYTLGCLYLLKNEGGRAEKEFERVYSNVPRWLYKSTPRWLSPSEKEKFIRERKKYTYMLLSIMKYFIEGKESPDTVEAGKFLKTALPFISSIDDLLRIHDYLQKHGMADSAKKTLKRAQEAAKTLDDKLKWASFLNKNKENSEEAQKYLDKLVKSYGATEDLLKITEFCLENKLYPMALSALKKINNIYYRRYPITDKFEAEINKISLPFPSVLPPSVKRPPISKKISLPVLYGIVSELDKKDDMAEKAYMQAVEAEVNWVINYAGTKLPTNLNNLFYLKQFWKKRGYESELAKLEPFYKLVERNYIKNLGKKLNDAKANYSKIEGSVNALRARINALENKIRHLKRAFLFRELRLLALVIVALGMIIFSFINAWQRTANVERYRAFAFLGKFIENIGWCQCFTIVLIPIGVLNILMGQFMWIVLDIYQQGIGVKQEGKSDG